MEEVIEKAKECKRNRVEEFFWYCSGANINILRCCPTDHSKYFGIGGTILFTALMASFAGGYAFFTAFHNQVLSILFGLFWGSMIFNLDRYIVVTIGKGDGTPRITKSELQSATPRLLMAILIGFVIATPLELKLFEKEINVEIQTLINEERTKLGNDTVVINELTALKIEQKDLNSLKKDIELGTYVVREDAGIMALKAEISDLTSQYNTKTSIVLNLEEQGRKYIQDEKSIPQELIDKITKNKDIKEQLNQQLNSKKKQYDELFKSKEGRVLNERDKVQARIDQVSERITYLEQQLIRTRGIADNVSTQYAGFMARIEAYERLQDKHVTLRIVGIFITLLFIFIEVAPVFFKMMTESGPYDDMIERIKHQESVRQKQKISDINDIINTDIEISIKKNQNRLNAEILANQELLNQIALAQAEIAKIAVERWKSKELENVIQNPYSVIQTNDNITNISPEATKPISKSPN